jgi:hypothetical protein
MKRTELEETAAFRAHSQMHVTDSASKCPLLCLTTSVSLSLVYLVESVRSVRLIITVFYYAMTFTLRSAHVLLSVYQTNTRYKQHEQYKNRKMEYKRFEPYRNR